MTYYDVGFEIKKLRHMTIGKKLNITPKLVILQNGLDIICIDEINDSTLNCSIIAISNEKIDQFEVREFEKVTVFSHTGDMVSFFGNNFSMLNLDIQKVSDLNGYFILPSTEFELDSLLTGFEFLSSRVSEIGIFVYDFENCKNESCKNWIYKSFPYIDKYPNSVNCGSFITINGLNRINLSQPIWVQKGSVIVLYTRYSNPILIDSVNEYEISDYNFDNNITIKIDLKRNLRFCFRALVNQSFYYTKYNYFTEIEFGKDENIKLVDLEAKIVGKNITLIKKINVTNVLELHDLDLTCDQYTYDLNSNCTIELKSQNSNLNFTVDISDKTRMISSLLLNKTMAINFFGFPISMHLLSIDYPFSSSNSFLLTNTEFIFDSYAIGFEFYSQTLCSSCFFITIISFDNMCQFTLSRSECLNKLTTINNYKKIFELTVSAQKGLNMIYLKKPIWVNKGSIVMVRMSSNGYLFYDRTGNAKYSDYRVYMAIDSKSFYTQRLDSVYNYAHYFNVLLDKKLYLTKYYFHHKFQAVGNYSVNVTFDSRILSKTIRILK
ncbi:unnamed protein product, partial [Brachionus calyciflorus]